MKKNFDELVKEVLDTSHEELEQLEIQLSNIRTEEDVNAFCKACETFVNGSVARKLVMEALSQEILAAVPTSPTVH